MEPKRVSYNNNDEDSLSIEGVIFQEENPIKGVSYLEQRDDNQPEKIVDTNYESEPGMEDSANSQGAALDQQVAHIQCNSFEFPTNPKVLLLPQIQLLFKELWNNIKIKNPYAKYPKNQLYVELVRSQIIDVCLLMSLLTGTSAEIWLNVQVLIDQNSLKKDKKRITSTENYQYFWYQKLDITKFSIIIDNEIVEGVQKNQHMTFALPIPNIAHEILTNHVLYKEKLPSKEDLKTRVFELRKELQMPVLSPDRIRSAMHFYLRRYADDHYVADLLCSESPRHSPGLFYGSFDLKRVEDAYANVIRHFFKKLENVDEAYLKPNFKLESLGSQITPMETVVIVFFIRLSQLLETEVDPIKQFNLYSIWQWHIFMLLTSCRPVNHMSGMRNQIAQRAKLIWLSDKEGRLTSSSGRFIPLCNFLENSFNDYVEYLQNYVKSYGATNSNTDSVLKGVLNSERPLLHIFQNNLLKPLTPKLVLDFVYEELPFPLNWPRYYGRYYLYENKVDINIVDAIMGHEAPSHEALHPFSSSSLYKIKAVGKVYEQMAVDLQLKRVKVDVA